MHSLIARITCERKQRLPEVQCTSDACIVPSMETIGSRIKNFRVRNDWSRPELGRRMGRAVGREDAFSGEAVRRYETGLDRPGEDAVRALSILMERDEAYIMYGTAQTARGSQSEGDILLSRVRQLSAIDQSIIESLLSKVPSTNETATPVRTVKVRKKKIDSK